MKDHDKAKREKTQNHLLRQMARYFPLDKYQAAKKYFDGLSDYDFWQLVAELKSSVGDDNVSLSEYLNLSKYLRDALGTTPDNAALRDMPVRFLDKKGNDALLGRIGRTGPSHVFKFDSDSDAEMIGLLTQRKEFRGKKTLEIPADLFFERTIPVMDCDIIVDETGEGGVVTNCRVVVFEDYGDRLETTDVLVLAGVLVTGPGLLTGPGLVLPIGIAKGVDYLVGNEFVGRTNEVNEAQMELLQKKLSMSDIQGIIVAFMSTWYGIQTSLLQRTDAK